MLHRAAYAALGLTGWTYQAIECDEPRLPGLLAGCGPDWAGLSLTMPLKRAVLDLLDEAEPLVAEVGAANTVTFEGGARRGHNTDVPGMITALAELGLPAAAGPPSVLILGAGATACSALAAVAGPGRHRGDGGRVRDPRRAGDLLAAAARLGVTVRVSAFSDPGVPAPGLLVSTAPAGAADSCAERISRGDHIPGCVLDVVYHPWPTPLAVAAAQAGSRWRAASRCCCTRLPGRWS